jgi:hypothetical protein
MCNVASSNGGSREHVSEDMNEKPEHAHSSLSETMTARIEINELGDPVRQREITDAITAMDGVIEVNLAKGALSTFLTIRCPRVRRRSSRLFAPAGMSSKPQPQIQKLRIQTCQHQPT